MFELLALLIFASLIIYLLFLWLNTRRILSILAKEPVVCCENDDEKFGQSLIQDLSRARNGFMFTSGTCYPRIWGQDDVVAAIEKFACDRNKPVRGILNSDEKLKENTTEAENLRRLVGSGYLRLYKLNPKGRQLKEKLKLKYEKVLKSRLREIDNRDEYPHFDFRVFDDSLHFHFHLDDNMLKPNRLCLETSAFSNAAQVVRRDFDSLLAEAEEVKLS